MCLRGLGVVVLSLAAFAGEVGHFNPGVVLIRDWTLPRDAGFYYLQYNVFYSASEYKDGQGNTDVTGQTDVFAYGQDHFFLWQTGKKFLGADYGVLVRPTFGRGSVNAVINAQERPPEMTSARQWGFGDLLVRPIFLGWHGTQLEATAHYSFVAPTGRYRTGSAVNNGLGMWSHQFVSSGFYYPTLTMAGDVALLPAGTGHYNLGSCRFRSPIRFSARMVRWSGFGRRIGGAMMNRRIFLFSTAAAAATSGVKVTTVYQSPGPAPNGLQATAEGLWVLDQRENLAYLVNYADGKVLRRLETDSKAGSGITFDGEAIWIASTYSREIIRADAKTGKTIVKYPSPGAGPVSWKPEEARRSPLSPPPAKPANPAPSGPRQATGAHGLEWRDGKLYISNPPSQKVYRVNPKGFEIEFEFATAGNRPHGLGWDGDYLWCADSNLNGFHKHDPKTGKIHDSIILSDSDPQPHGMTIWKGEMWYCDEAGVICKFRLR